MGFKRNTIFYDRGAGNALFNNFWKSHKEDHFSKTFTTPSVAAIYVITVVISYLMKITVNFKTFLKRSFDFTIFVEYS